MPETPSTHPTRDRLQADDRFPTGKPIEAYADQLLDDVFEDVDRLLDRAEQLPQEPADPKPISIKPIQIPPIVVQPLVAPAAAPRPATSSVEVASEEREKAKVDKSFLWFDRLLLGGAFVSLLIVLGLWLVDRGIVQKWFGTAETEAEPETPTLPVVEDPKAIADQEFANYISQSLDRIDNRQANAMAVESETLPDAPSGLATLSIPVNPTSPDTVAQSLSRIANALERVSTTPVPLPDLPENADNPTPPALQPETTVSVPDTPAPLEEDIEPEPVATAAVEPVEKTPETTASTPSSTSSNVYTLVGTLERGEGDRPAALFEINGLPQWVDVGEAIGGSGWMLVDVTGDRVSLRRNGEVRSIYVGQQF
ncbi:MAG: hypothetical protein J7641_23100 [Cyanobacteria bacterium SID2]|nr:hypothetical protein [Cyanobacteria bacterium SID2]MBP0003932.1 hypothetical protein [Cyanobacteria bacterium SBC]